jgi:hypothetical protein
LQWKRGRFTEAEPLYRRALRIYEKVFGSEHAETANVIAMLARVLSLTGDFVGAQLLAGRAYDIAARTLGEKHPTTVAMKDHLNALMMQLAPAHSN